MAGAQTLYLNSEQRARVLDGALGWTRKFRGNIIVIKYGGHAMTDPDAQEAFASDVQFLQHTGMFPVVVHGGDPQVSAMFSKLGIGTPFCEGVRVTAPEVIEIVRMILTDQVQRRFASRLSQRDSLTVGISGEDGALFNAKRRTGVGEKGEEIDSGPVDGTMSADPNAVLKLPDAGCIPVISLIAIDQDSTRQVLNINVDVVTSTLAVTLGVSKFLMFTGVRGVYSNYPGPDPLLHYMTPLRLRVLGGAISSGMIPKVQACLQVVEGGVDAVHMMDGRRMYSVFIKVMTDEGTGTMVVPDSAEKNT